MQDILEYYTYFKDLNDEKILNELSKVPGIIDAINNKGIRKAILEYIVPNDLQDIYRTYIDVIIYKTNTNYFTDGPVAPFIYSYAHSYNEMKLERIEELFKDKSNFSSSKEMIIRGVVIKEGFKVILLGFGYCYVNCFTDDVVNIQPLAPDTKIKCSYLISTSEFIDKFITIEQLNAFNLEGLTEEGVMELDKLYLKLTFFTHYVAYLDTKYAGEVKVPILAKNIYDYKTKLTDKQAKNLTKSGAEKLLRNSLVNYKDYDEVDEEEEATKGPNLSTVVSRVNKFFKLSINKKMNETFYINNCLGFTVAKYEFTEGSLKLMTKFNTWTYTREQIIALIKNGELREISFEINESNEINVFENNEKKCGKKIVKGQLAFI